MVFLGGTFVLFLGFLSLVPALGILLPGLFPNGGVVARVDGDGGGVGRVGAVFDGATPFGGFSEDWVGAFGDLGLVGGIGALFDGAIPDRLS